MTETLIDRVVSARRAAEAMHLSSVDAPLSEAQKAAILIAQVQVIMGDPVPAPAPPPADPAKIDPTKVETPVDAKPAKPVVEPAPAPAPAAEVKS